MPGLAASLLAELADELGLEFLVEPEFGYAGQLTLPNGERRYCRGTIFDINPAGATEIANDKAWTSFFLQSLGYPVPVGETFFSREWCDVIGSDRGAEAAWSYALSLGLPVVVKPNSKSQGVGVSIARSREEFDDAVDDACAHDRVFLVQKPARGADHRIVVLDGEVVSAYQRDPLTITGDGVSTVASLIRQREARFRTSGRGTRIPRDDRRVITVLRHQNLGLDAVPVAGRVVLLLPIANLSAGGEAHDITETLHADWSKLCATIARDMNLRLAGIDILSEEPLSLPPSSFTVLEVNAAPGLDNYAATGAIQKERVRNLYRRILRALTEPPAVCDP